MIATYILELSGRRGRGQPKRSGRPRAAEARYGASVSVGARLRRRRSTKRRCFIWVPHSFIEHQRRLWLRLWSRNSQRQLPQIFRCSSGPLVSSSTAAWVIGRSGSIEGAGWGPGPAHRVASGGRQCARVGRARLRSASRRRSSSVGGRLRSRPRAGGRSHRASSRSSRRAPQRAAGALLVAAGRAGQRLRAVGFGDRRPAARTRRSGPRS